MTQLENSQTLRLSGEKLDLCYKEGRCLPLTRGEEVGEKHGPEPAVDWGGERGTGSNSLIDPGLSSGLTEMMNLLAHSLGNSVHFQDNQTVASLSTGLTWFGKGHR